MDFDLSGFQIAHMKPFSILRERRVILNSSIPAMRKLILLRVILPAG